MIKDSIDFDYAIKELTTFLEPKIQYQGRILDSKNMNVTFEEIETTLNHLYEKTRFLEDSIAYARTFLDTKVREFNDEMDSIIKELESTLDMSKNLSYLSYNVPLKPNELDEEDQSRKMPPLILKDKVLTLGYEVDNDINFSSVTTISDSVSFDNTLNSIVENKNYKTIFLEEKILKDGLTETLVVYFPSPATINVLDLAASNCKIKNIRFGLINGIEEYANDYTVSMNNIPRTCIYVKFDLVCSNYSTIIYEVDKSKLTDNLWNDLKEFEIAKTTDLGKLSKLNAEYIISRTAVNKITGESIKENFQDSTGKQTTSLVMYSYVFGLDKLNFKYAKEQTAGYFISDPINLGRMASIEHITLHTSHVKDKNCCIEYSILDGNIEIPLVPIGTTLIENEPIILGKDLRFSRKTPENSLDYEQEIIKKDGLITDISYADALTMSDGQYTITYKPLDDHFKIKGLMNESVRVKCYIRTFGNNINTKSYIESITIRKYGEDSLWINRY